MATAMRQRVACSRCGAHRDLTIAPKCLVCGAESFVPVSPTAGDLDAIAREVIAAAEDVDIWLKPRRADCRCMYEDDPPAIRLREACRRLALARAGVLCR